MCRALSPPLSEHRLPNSQLRVDSRRYTTQARIVEDGGSVSYGVSIMDLDRRAATYVDKILKDGRVGE